MLDQSQPPVCLGPAFMHLIQADQWPSLKFEGNSTRQLLQSVWFKKSGNLDNSQSQFLEYDVTHLDRNPCECAVQKKWVEYGTPNIFDNAEWIQCGFFRGDGTLRPGHFHRKTGIANDCSHSYV